MPKTSPPKKRVYRKRRTKAPKKNPGLNKKEKLQVTRMIKGKRETFFLQTIQYALGNSINTTFDKHHLTPRGCFSSGNKITMIGLVTAESLNSMGQDVNSNSVHTTGQRLYLTGGVRARDLNGISGANLDGDMGYMKSHLQRLKIHARTLLPDVQQDKLIPLNFRVLVVQVNGNKPAGSLPSFTNVNAGGNPCLFRDRENIKKGIDDQIPIYEFTHNLRVDTQAFKVVRDIKFKLSNPLLYKNASSASVENATSSVYQYPATKEIDLWLPQPKKPVKFDEGTQLPTNYDYRYYTFVFCSSDSTYGVTTTTLGTTEDRWVLESTSIARCQEY